MICPNKAKPGLRPFSQLQHPREVIRQFTPNWFAATMGTGVLALALAQLPVHIPGIHVFAEGLWLFNIVLFILFSVLYGARWVPNTPAPPTIKAPMTGSSSNHGCGCQGRSKAKR